MGKRLIEEPWTMVAADIMGPLPLCKKGKNQYVLVLVDLFTKWVEIHTDNGTEFVNKTIRELTEKFGIRHTKTPKYYHQANPTERYNRTIKQIIRAYLDNNHATRENNVIPNYYCQPVRMILYEETIADQAAVSQDRPGHERKTFCVRKGHPKGLYRHPEGHSGQ